MAQPGSKKLRLCVVELSMRKTVRKYELLASSSLQRLYVGTSVKMNNTPTSSMIIFPYKSVIPHLDIVPYESVIPYESSLNSVHPTDIIMLRGTGLCIVTEPLTRKTLTLCNRGARDAHYCHSHVLTSCRPMHRHHLRCCPIIIIYLPTLGDCL